MRKRKHPYQVMDISHLTVGARYAFVFVSDVEHHAYMMAGVISDTNKLALQRSYDLTQYRAAETPMSALIDHYPPDDTEFVTVHLDGWNGSALGANRPTLVYWTAHHMRRSWDNAISYIDHSGYPEPQGYDKDCFVVPLDRWLADPRIHAACDESPMIERSVQTRTDDNLRHVFG